MKNPHHMQCRIVNLPSATWIVFAFSLLLGGRWLAVAQSFLDDFQSNQPALSLASPASDSSLGTNGMTGNERDLRLQLASGGPISAGVELGTFTFIQASAGEGSVELQWDGSDRDASILNDTGLGGINLKSGGHDAFLLGIHSLDKPLTATLKVYTSQTLFSTRQWLLPGGVTGTNWVQVPYNTFTGNADFENVGAIQLLFETSDSVSLSLDFIRTASSAAVTPLHITLTDLVLVDADHNGQASAGDRLRYVMRVANTGATDLHDVQVDIPTVAHTILDAASIRMTPLAREDGPAADSAPAQLYHGALNTDLSLSASQGLLANDFAGAPAAQITHFGGGSLGGAVTNEAGSTNIFLEGSLTVQADGSLVFSPASDFAGLITFYYRLANSAGSDEGRVTLAVGQRPATAHDTYDVTGNVQMNTSLIPLSVLANDSAEGVTVSVDTTGTLGGVVMSPSGHFVYTPPVGKSSGEDSFSYTIQNGFGSKTATVTLRIANLVWSIDGSASAPGDGRSHAPFNTMGAFNAANTGSEAQPAPGHAILLRQGTYDTGITLLLDQKLLGDATPGSLNTALGFDLAPGSDLDGFSGTAPVINAPSGSAISLALNNTVRGLTVGNTPSGFGILGTPCGNLVISHCGKDGGGGALKLSSGTNVNVSLSACVASSASAEAISVSATSGAISIAGANITDPTGTAIYINGGTVNLNFSGNITQTKNSALLSAHNAHTGALTFQSGTLDATSGTGLDFNNADGTYNFNGTVALHGGDAGIDILNGSSGTFSFGASTAITNPSGTAFNLASSSANITYDGNITDSTGYVINIEGYSAGTITFQNGTIHSTGLGIRVSSCSSGVINFNSPAITLTTGTSTAVSLTGSSQTSPTIRFGGGGLTITTTTGTGFSASYAGNLSISGDTNVISVSGANSGRALSVANTTIGAGGLTFRSVSSSGCTSSGIYLGNTGTQGGLKVTGTGVADSGGVIQSSSSHGIYLDNTYHVYLDRIKISNTSGSGIKGVAVQNFTLTNSVIMNSGTGMAADTANISFNDASFSRAALSGTVSIVNNTLQTATYHGIDIANYSGTISDLQIRNNVIASSTAASASLGSGIRWITDGTSSTAAQVNQALINNNQIRNFPNGAGIIIQGNSPGPAIKLGTAHSTTEIIRITGNLISGDLSDKMETQGISVAVNQAGQGNFEISNNGSTADRIRNMAGSGIAVSAFGPVIVSATIANNYVSPNNILGSPGISVGLDQYSSTNDAPDLTVTMSGNEISNSDGVGIYALARNCQGILKAKIQNNTVSAPLSGVRPGIRVDSGSASGNTTVHLNISGNTSAGRGMQGIGLRKQGTTSTVNVFGIHSLSPSPTGSPTVENYVNSLNPAGSGTLLISGTSGFVSAHLP